MSTLSVAICGETPASPAGSAQSFPASAWRTLRLLGHVLQVRRQRRALLALDDRMLSDIGVGRGEAYREAHRGLFDLPYHR